MRNLLALLGLALVVVGGVGWYLGWYRIKSEPTTNPGHHNVSIDIDTNKVRKDLHNGEEKLHKMLDSSKADPAKPDKDNPGKSGSAVTLPEVSGFPFDSSAPPAGGSGSVAPSAAKPSADDAPIPVGYLAPR